MYLYPLNSGLDATLVGGKADGLSKLISCGVNVPHGFVAIKDLLVAYKHSSSFPDSFEKELITALSRLNSKEIIVRSSAIGEDSASHSFAGQLDSFVVNNQYPEVQQAMIKCWESLNNDRVAAYQSATGIVLSEMGIVIQEFLDADYAGVTFTQSPYNEKQIFSEYVSGAGEQLVSGRITPRNFSVEPGGKIKENLPFNGDELIRKSILLKDAFGCHLDIEWVAKGKAIYFVQARPITVKHRLRVHWSNTNLNENYPDPISPLLYSIARDSYYHYFKNLAVLIQISDHSIRKLEYDFSNTVGIWGNRLYYNMTSIHNILSSSPLKSYFKEAFNQFVGYAAKDVSTADNSGRTSLGKMAMRLVGLNMKLESHVQKIENMVDDYSSNVKQAGDLVDYRDLFYTFLDLRFNQWYHASLADFFSMIHYKSLGKFTKRFYGEQSIGMHNTLIQAIPGLVSSEPLNEIFDISNDIQKDRDALELFLNHSSAEVYDQVFTNEKWMNIRIQIEEYLDKWGFRCSGELMFFSKNYLEEPARFIELLQNYLQQEARDPRGVIAEKADERKKAMRSFARKIFWKRHVLVPLSILETAQLYLTAKLCKQAISSRERVRYKQAEMYYRFKVVVKRLGEGQVETGILESAEDMFFLNYKEIGELISSSDMFHHDLKALVDNRKKSFDKESSKVFPEHFSTLFGERPDSVAEEIHLKEGIDGISGLAASGGKIQARVKVLETVMQSDKLKKGDILVTRQTDPGWAMVFPIIGGLIVERGGALSHGAIVAREFGIPAVIGIPNITEMLKDNDEVILDGDLGKIQILKP